MTYHCGSDPLQWSPETSLHWSVHIYHNNSNNNDNNGHNNDIYVHILGLRTQTYNVSGAHVRL